MQIVITLSIIATATVFFAWNRVPAAAVAVCTSLALYFTGILTMQETLAGFGDPVVILIAALVAIASGLEIAGVGTWAGQLLMRHTRANNTLRIVAIMIIAAVFSGLIGMNGAVAAFARTRSLGAPDPSGIRSNSDACVGSQFQSGVADRPRSRFRPGNRARPRPANR